MSAPTHPVYYLGQRNPSVTEVISVGGEPLDLVALGASVQFKMRAFNSSTLKVNASAALDPGTGGEVRYDPSASDFDTVGYYVVWWEVTVAGKVQHVLEAFLEVVQHAPATGFMMEPEEMRQRLELRSITRELDSKIKLLIGAASQVLGQECGREIVPGPDCDAAGVATRDFPLESGGELLDLAPYDLRSVTSVTVAPGPGAQVLVADMDYALSPLGKDDFGVYTELLMSGYLALSTDRERRFGSHLVRIVGTWGMPTIPERAKQACAATVQSWLRLGIASQERESGDVRTGMPMADASYTVPVAARRLLDPLRRNVGAL